MQREALNFAQFASLLYFVDHYLGRVDLVHGPSMQPTLAPVGALVFVDKWSVRPFFSSAPSLQRNDIVLCDSHYRASYVVCKRVVGVAGDVLLLRDRGAVVRVPAGHVWLEGDNPLDSHDSRAYGAIPAALVQGRVAACVWPPWRAQAFPRGAPPGAGVLRNASNAVLLAGAAGEAAGAEEGLREGWVAAAAAAAAAEGAGAVAGGQEGLDALMWGESGGWSPAALLAAPGEEEGARARDALEEAVRLAQELVRERSGGAQPPELR